MKGRHQDKKAKSPSARCRSGTSAELFLLPPRSPGHGTVDKLLLLPERFGVCRLSKKQWRMLARFEEASYILVVPSLPPSRPVPRLRQEEEACWRKAKDQRPQTKDQKPKDQRPKGHGISASPRPDAHDRYVLVHPQCPPIHPPVCRYGRLSSRYIHRRNSAASRALIRYTADPSNPFLALPLIDSVSQLGSERNFMRPHAGLSYRYI